VTRPWVRRGIYGLRTAGSPGRVGGSQEQDISSGVDRTISRNGGGSNGGGSGSQGGLDQMNHGGSHAAMSVTTGNTHSEHKGTAGAMVPSWRLAEEAQKRRDLQAENLALKERIADLERVIRAGRLAQARRVG
jgi:hypothetical protein